MKISEYYHNMNKDVQKKLVIYRPKLKHNHCMLVSFRLVYVVDFYCKKLKSTIHWIIDICYAIAMIQKFYLYKYVN